MMRVSTNLLLLLLLVSFTQCSEPGEDSISSDESESNELMDQTYTDETSDYSGRPIVFYNVENLFDTEDDPHTDDDDFTPYGEMRWDEERYQNKLENLAEAFDLFGEQPAMIGLAEVENRTVLKDLIQTGNLRKMNYGIAHFDSPDRRGIDCALLYDKEVFEMTNSEKVSIRLEEDPRFVTRDILYVTGNMGGNELHVFVNHWSSRREGKHETEYRRMGAAEILRERIDEIFDFKPDANILILGDFNDHPDDKSLEYVLRAKASGYEQDGDLINLLYDHHETGEGTSVHDQEWGVIDQIIVSQALYDNRSGIGIEKNGDRIQDDHSLLFTYKDGRQKPNATYGGRKYYGGYSDHLPVYIILK